MKNYIVGIDEVGRGSLAGPVVVAAVSISQGLQINFRDGGKLRDSKKLTPQKREQWFKYIKSRPEISFALARVYPRRIEKMNISKAANLAAFRAYDRLIANGEAQRARHRVFLDGGLYLGNGREPSLDSLASLKLLRSGPRRDGQRANNKWQIVKTIVRGDEKVKAIKLASIVAKVYRDRLMKRLGKIYPKYGFEIHKGYGTKTHFKSIKKHGPSKVHRLTFLKK